MSGIKVGIIGVGNCAKSLIEGVEYHSSISAGLHYKEIGGYGVGAIEFVWGIDVDPRKVGKPLNEAIYAKPNCAMDICEVSGASGLVYKGVVLDGVADHMLEYPEEISFRVDPKQPGMTKSEYSKLLSQVDMVVNYLPVGSEKASEFYLVNAIKAGVSVINCMPSFISTEDAKLLEALAIENGVCIIGSDMRSAFGASRLSEVLQGALLDAGLDVTQHIQMNMAAGTTQGQEKVRNGRSANTDFLNMAERSRLKNKHISKENVLSGQSIVRDCSTAGKTMYAGPSLTVLQRPGGEYVGTDNKIANLDLVAYGFGGARYELTCRLSVQDSPNSGGVVVDAIRFVKVGTEMGIKGFLRGASAYTQKTPPVHLTTADAIYECDKLAQREFTELTRLQVGDVCIDELPYTNMSGKTEYEN